MFVWQPPKAALVRLYFSAFSTVAPSGCRGNDQNLGDRGADAPAFTPVSPRWAPRRLICHSPLPRSWKDLAVTRHSQYRTFRQAPPPCRPATATSLSDNRQLYQQAQRRQFPLPACRCSQSTAFKQPCRGQNGGSDLVIVNDVSGFERMNKHWGAHYILNYVCFLCSWDHSQIFAAHFYQEKKNSKSRSNLRCSNKQSQKIFTKFFNSCISSSKLHESS